MSCNGSAGSVLEKAGGVSEEAGAAADGSEEVASPRRALIGDTPLRLPLLWPFLLLWRGVLLWPSPRFRNVFVDEVGGFIRDQ